MERCARRGAEFSPSGGKTHRLEETGFELLTIEDVTGHEVEVSRRWHAARQRRAMELIRQEGEETFIALQQFLEPHIA